MIVFENPGLIDVRAIRTFGLHVKPATDNPIGAFGTGLKVALAVLLRLNQKVTLWRGLDRYTFRTESVDSRGKEFEVVHMDGPDQSWELPFTLHLGFHWANWTPFREMHSNVLDERGTTYHATSYTPKENHTAFVVEGNEIEQAYHERATIFLDTPVIDASMDIARHNGTSRYIYYRGVRVHQCDYPSMYTYNLLNHQELTEDRTLKDQSDPAFRLAYHIAGSEDEAFLRRVLIADKDTFEHHIPCYTMTPSETFVRVYTELRKAGEMSRMTFFATHVFSGGKKTLPLPDPIEMTPIQQKQLARALEFCARAGWPVEDYPIVVVPHASDGLLALAENGTIVLTVGCFDLGIKTIVHALYEEYLHLKHGFKDHSRELQSHLFRQVVGAYEQILEEAL